MNRNADDLNKDKLPIILSLIIPKVIDLIIKNHDIDELSAIEEFYNSKVYRVLEDEKTKIWHFSPLTLYEMYEYEKQNGELYFPVEG